VGIAAWLLCALFYFYQYSLRSAPSVMVPELTGAFGLTTLGVSALLGMYYYTYSPVSLVAGVVLAMILACFLEETGSARKTKESTEMCHE
jgi:hypothetical protein